MSKIADIVDIIKVTGKAVIRAVKTTIVDHDGIEHAGYLAYLSMLALFPFLVLLVFILATIGEADIGSKFIERLLSSLPPEAVDALRPRINQIASGPPEGLVTLSIIGAIWTASSAVEGLRTVLNRAYHVSTPPAYILRRLMSVFQLLIFTAIIISGLLLLVFAPTIQHKLEIMLGIEFTTAPGDWEFSDVLFYFGAVTLFVVVANIYYILPNIKQSLMDVVPGAAITIALWAGAASAYSYYLSSFDQVHIIYGSLGGIIASLIFFFIINLCLILGAEINYHLARALGTKLEIRDDTPSPTTKHTR